MPQSSRGGGARVPLVHELPLYAEDGPHGAPRDLEHLDAEHAAAAAGQRAQEGERPGEAQHQVEGAQHKVQRLVARHQQLASHPPAAHAAAAAAAARSPPLGQPPVHEHVPYEAVGGLRHRGQHEQVVVHPGVLWHVLPARAGVELTQVTGIDEREGRRVLKRVPQVLLLARLAVDLGFGLGFGLGLAVDLEALHEAPPEGQREHERVEAALVARGVVSGPQLGGAHVLVGALAAEDGPADARSELHVAEGLGEGGEVVRDDHMPEGHGPEGRGDRLVERAEEREARLVVEGAERHRAEREDAQKQADVAREPRPPREHAGLRGDEVHEVAEQQHAQQLERGVLRGRRRLHLAGEHHVEVHAAAAAQPHDPRPAGHDKEEHHRRAHRGILPQELSGEIVHRRLVHARARGDEHHGDEGAERQHQQREDVVSRPLARALLPLAIRLVRILVERFHDRAHPQVAGSSSGRGTVCPVIAALHSGSLCVIFFRGGAPGHARLCETRVAATLSSSVGAVVAGPRQRSREPSCWRNLKGRQQATRLSASLTQLFTLS
eukprot:scaffold110032_cov66-Phaeocystis_antarctica.AAC.2